MLKKLVNKIQKKLYKINVKYQSIEPSMKVATDYQEGYCLLPANLLHKDAIFYSFGAGEDIEVETNFVSQFDCDVHIFDPTPRSLNHINKLKETIAAGKKMPVGSIPNTFYKISADKLSHIHFHPLGVWEEDTKVKFFEPSNKEHVSHSITNLQETDDYIEVKVKQLKTIMQELGHSHIDFLKMDIEGAEFKVIDNILATGVKFHALYLEFHHVDMSKYVKSTQHIESYIHKLEKAGYVFLSGTKNKYFSCVHKDWLAKK